MPESPNHPTTLPITPSFSLQGKRALVSGASRGLGLAAAAALAQAGAEVCCVARNEDDLQRVARACAEQSRDEQGRGEQDREKQGWKMQVEALDILERKSVESFLSAHTPFDILVNNAGMNRPQPFLQVDEDTYDKIMDLNLRATFFLSQLVARGMRERGGGSIIHVSSQMGRVGGEQRTVYCAAKHGVEGLTKSMALDLASLGIRVNSIAPTFIETDLTRSFLQSEDERAAIVARIPLGRLGKVEDIMGAIVFLASNASSLITGTSLAIDGGWTAV